MVIFMLLVNVVGQWNNQNVQNVDYKLEDPNISYFKGMNTLVSWMVVLMRLGVIKLIFKIFKRYNSYKMRNYSEIIIYYEIKKKYKYIRIKF